VAQVTQKKNLVTVWGENLEEPFEEKKEKTAVEKRRTDVFFSVNRNHILPSFLMVAGETFWETIGVDVSSEHR
jgi:hypothetical protein